MSLSVAAICGCGGKIVTGGSGGSGGSGGGAAADFSITASVASVTLTPGSQQPVTLSATALNGFSGTISVGVSGLPSGVTASPTTFNLVPGTPQQVNLSASAMAAAGSSTAQFTATSGTLSHTAPVIVIVETASTPDFSITANVPSLSVTDGTQQPVTLSATALNGFSGTISVGVSGLPAGVTATPSSFTLVPGTPQQVALAASSSAAAGTSTVQFVGTSGALNHTASVSLTIKSAVNAQAVDVVTYHYDIGRTGLNPNETILAPANVTASKFGLLMLLPVDGKVDAQPLYLSNLTAGGLARNVLYVATENDSVYAFDADTGAQIWKTSVLGANETPSGDHGCGQITPQIGITSTPVIDRFAGPNGTIFVVGMSLDQAGAYHQRLHALDVTTGAELANSPSEVHATFPGTGENSSGGNVVFDPGQYAERAGLLLMNGVIYMGWTSHCDAEPYTGWLMGYSESTLAQSAVLNLTPNGSEGSIWMAGAGLAADSSGNIYFLDANGTFDTTLNASGFPASGDFGNGFLKVSTAGGTLTVADYFQTYNTVAESSNDIDLGSGGALVLPDLTDTAGTVHHLAVGAGKDQNIYVVNRDSMGKFNAQNNNAIYQEVTGAIGGVWSMPAYFNNTVYYGAVSDTLKAFAISNARLAAAPSFASANSFAYPGTTPAISASGTTNGIVWAVENASPAVLHAFDATNLQELYNSNQAANNRDHFGNGNKFITPMEVNGKVYVGTPSSVAVFGLLP